MAASINRGALSKGFRAPLKGLEGRCKAGLELILRRNIGCYGGLLYGCPNLRDPTT